MIKVSELSSMRKDIEANVSRPFVEYTEKYIEKVQDKCDGSTKYLQKTLRSMGEWDSSKVDREYNKFLKWCLKRGTTVEYIRENLNKFVVLSLRIMLSKKIQDEIIKDYEVNIKDFFYKCMRRVARREYDNVTSQTNGETKDTTTIVISCLHEFIPLEKLIEIMELFDEEEDSNHSYDFNKTFSDSEDIKKIVIEKYCSNSNDSTDKATHDAELHYVPSENFEDEYYHSDDSKSKDSNIKEIKLPKYNNNKGLQANKKRKTPIKKPKINEKDENFFSE